jgi:hypothetical protein
MRRRARTAVVAIGLVTLPGLAAARNTVPQTPRAETVDESVTQLVLTSERDLRQLEDGAAQDALFDLEVRAGVTDGWELSAHQTMAQSTGGATAHDRAVPLHLTEMGGRGRYRISAGWLPVDTIFDLEVDTLIGVGRWTFEPGITAVRELGPLTLALNPLLDVSVGGDLDGTKLEPGWAAGLSYRARPELSVGVDSWGGFDVHDVTGTAEGWVGPTVGWTPTKKMTLLTTAGFGLTGASDALELSGVFLLKL